jgi:Fuc2NAc and GlcNAc transferase
VVADPALTLLFAGLSAAVIIGYVVVRVALRFGLVARPNARSSHQTPTPAIGGLAFVLPVVAWLLWVAAAGSAHAAGFAAAGALLAVVGLIDDLREVPSSLRLLCHGSAAAVVLWVLAPDVGPVWLAILGLGLVWLINLYNFMDGIDGLAAAQCLVFAVGAQVLAGGVPGWPGDVLWLLAGAVVGFLVYNWPPARMFMGDGGSAFLGCTMGALALLLWLHGVLPLVASVILLAGFWLDASYTLAVRVVTRQRFTEPHRTHLYQKIATKRGHRWTTVAFLLFAGLWLLPLAALSVHATQSPMMSWLLVPLAALPSFVAAWRFGAGIPDAHVIADDH